MKRSLPARPLLPPDLYLLSNTTKAVISAAAVLSGPSIHHLPVSLPFREAAHLAINASRQHHWAQNLDGCTGQKRLLSGMERVTYNSLCGVLCSAIFRNLPQILVKWDGLLCSTRLLFLYGEQLALIEMLTQGDPV